jgi:hypothetical protein
VYGVLRYGSEAKQGLGQAREDWLGVEDFHLGPSWTEIYRHPATVVVVVLTGQWAPCKPSIITDLKSLIFAQSISQCKSNFDCNNIWEVPLFQENFILTICKGVCAYLSDNGGFFYSQLKLSQCSYCITKREPNRELWKSKPLCSL